MRWARRWSLSRSPWVDVRLALLAALGGLVFDTIYIQLHLLDYASPQPWQAVAPYWILGMWINFALTLNGSMRWLHGRYLLAAGLGAIGGPLAYMAGVRLGAAEPLASGTVVYGSLAVAWAIAVPLLVLATERVNRRWPPNGPVSGQEKHQLRAGVGG